MFYFLLDLLLNDIFYIYLFIYRCVLVLFYYIFVDTECKYYDSKGLVLFIVERLVFGVVFSYLVFNKNLIFVEWIDVDVFVRIV